MERKLRIPARPLIGFFPLTKLCDPSIHIPTNKSRKENKNESDKIIKFFLVK